MFIDGSHLKSTQLVRTAGMILVAVLALIGSSTAVAQSEIEGVWINGDGDGWIELQINEGVLEGKIVGSPDDPENRKPSRLDTENPNKALRSRAVRGLTILSGFRHDAGERWTGGRVYDPNSGNTYRGTITVIDIDTLKLRGFIGISLFGRTEFWRRRDVE